jgi:hypothetical protein
VIETSACYKGYPFSIEKDLHMGKEMKREPVGTINVGLRGKPEGIEEDGVIPLLRYPMGLHVCGT